MQQSVWSDYWRTRVNRQPTRVERFLATMDQAIPWSRLVQELEAAYPDGRRGRRPLGLERMLRIHLLQQWYGYSDQAVVEALINMLCLQAFAGFDGGCTKLPDRSTVAKFRHWLERHAFARILQQVVDEALDEAGLAVRPGTVVDATVVEASQSKKNQACAADPEMGRTRKQNNWKYGVKLHIGVDADSRRIHHASVTPANVHDSQVLGDLLHGGEREVYGDSAYVGQDEVLAAKAPKAKNRMHRRAVRGSPLTPRQRRSNRLKSKIRARVEHPFRIIKCQFGHRRLRYHGLAKNAHQLGVLCALANVYLFRDRLVRLHG